MCKGVHQCDVPHLQGCCFVTTLVPCPGIAGCLEEDDGGLFPPPPAIEEGKSVADKGLPRNCGGREGGGAIRAATTPHHLGEAVASYLSSSRHIALINVRYNLVFGSPDVIAVECKKSHASWIVLDK
ncbi:hypothetical protein ZEAMMB73_Zm00001d041835 [Zea mays]|uniref:Uncharacterized protein n=1 Tax=Zea mays TaxID=4577 RepID=A0A1D6MYM2_MAIZE|nr:hypothetical protein ZEAMMB73_Zm00001d041835 [Zea mays]